MLKLRSLLSNLAISCRSLWLEPYLFYGVGKNYNHCAIVFALESVNDEIFQSA